MVISCDVMLGKSVWIFYLIEVLIWRTRGTFLLKTPPESDQWFHKVMSNNWRRHNYVIIGFISNAANKISLWSEMWIVVGDSLNNVLILN